MVVVGVELLGDLTLLQCFIEAPPFGEKSTEIVAGLGVARIQSDCFAIRLFRHRPIKIVRSGCEHCLRLRRVRIECECLFCGFSLDFPVLARAYWQNTMRIAETYVSKDEIGVGVNSLLEVRRGLP